uniref:Uncharacterized protein n=1 Tax=Arundo donax TaxID=35708 RepID=A0A0A9BCL8_ARUDO
MPGTPTLGTQDHGPGHGQQGSLPFQNSSAVPSTVAPHCRGCPGSSSAQASVALRPSAFKQYVTRCDEN